MSRWQGKSRPINFNFLNVGVSSTTPSRAPHRKVQGANFCSGWCNADLRSSMHVFMSWWLQIRPNSFDFSWSSSTTPTRRLIKLTGAYSVWLNVDKIRADVGIKCFASLNQQPQPENRVLRFKELIVKEDVKVDLCGNSSHNTNSMANSAQFFAFVHLKNNPATSVKLIRFGEVAMDDAMLTFVGRFDPIFIINSFIHLINKPDLAPDMKWKSF